MRSSRVTLLILTAGILVSLGGLTGAASLTAPGGRGQDAPAGFRDEFLHQFDMSMNKVIALAEAIPADRYAKSAVPLRPAGCVLLLYGPRTVQPRQRPE